MRIASYLANKLNKVHTNCINSFQYTKMHSITQLKSPKESLVKGVKIPRRKFYMLSLSNFPSINILLSEFVKQLLIEFGDKFTQLYIATVLQKCLVTDLESL